MTLRNEPETAAQRGSVHAHHNRLHRTCAHSEEFLVRRRQIVVRQGGLVKIHTRTEDLAGGSDENGSYVTAVLCGGNRRCNAAAHVARQRVALVWTVQRYLQDPVLLVDG